MSFDGTEAMDRPRRDAAALVADCYTLFLLGPMLLAGRWSADRSLVLAMMDGEDVTLDEQAHVCDRAADAPGAVHAEWAPADAGCRGGNGFLAALFPGRRAVGGGV